MRFRCSGVSRFKNWERTSFPDPFAHQTTLAVSWLMTSVLYLYPFCGCLRQCRYFPSCQSGGLAVSSS